MKIHGTAKGGALSTKDFGVAFGGAAALVETSYEYLPTTSVLASDAGEIYFIGEGANTTDSLFYNSYVQSVNFYVYRANTGVTGTCKAVQMNESGQEVHEFWEKDIEELGTANQVMSTESSTPSTVKFEQYHSLGLVSTSFIKMGLTLVDGFDGSDTCRITYTNFDDPSWSRVVNPTYDMAFKVVVGR